MVAVPAVTVLISNMGDTVVRVIDEGTAWIGERSILPERKEDVKKSDDDPWRIRILKKKTPEKGKARDTTTVSDAEIHIRNDNSLVSSPTSTLSSRQSHGPDSATRQRRQTITQAAEEGRKTEEEMEKERDSELTLILRLTQEIRQVAKDAAHRPTHRYRWDEWVRWLRLMDEVGGTLEVATGAPLDGGSKTSSVELYRWTWLGDRGPLFSPESETEWILNRLCLLLERVVQHEVKQV